jgi:hypothetical protein
MTSVHITLQIDSTARRVARTLLLTALGVVTFVVIDRILRRQIDPVDLAAFAVCLAVFMFWSDRAAPTFDLEFDGDQMRVLRQGRVKQTVSKERIRYVCERSGNFVRNPMLVISERGAVGTHFLGGIAVPAGIPEYEQIKTQALCWLENSKK